MSSIIKLCLLLAGIVALSFSAQAQTQTVDFSMNPNPACANAPVQFTDMSSPQTSIISRSWYFEDGTPNLSTEANPMVTFGTPGVKLCTLTVQFAGIVPIYITETKMLTVGEALTVSFTADQIAARQFSFVSTTTNVTQWSWNFGDGQISNQQSPNHTYANEGTYNVTLSVFGPCGSTTATTQVTALNAPNADFTMSSSSGVGCAPFTVNFSAVADPQDNTYQWTFPGGTPASSNLRNPQVTWNTPGEYEATLTVTNAFGETTNAEPISVLGVPQVAFSYQYTGNTYTFTPYTVGGTSFSWNLGDGTISNQNNPVHVYAPGTYTVTVTASNDCGSATSSGTIMVIEAPNAFFSTSSTSNNVGCVPLAISFFCAADPAVNTFEWTFQNGIPATSNLPNPQVVWNDPGVHEVKLKVTNALGSDYSSAMVTAYGGPVLSYYYSWNGNVVSFVSNSMFANSVLWQFGDGATSTDASTVHTYAPGSYLVTLTAYGNCDSSITTFPIVIAGPSAVNDLETVPVKVFPNPTTDAMTITLPDDMVKDGTQLYLHGVDGRVKRTLQTLPGDNNINLGMTALPAGYYILTVQTAEQKGVVKVVKL